MSSLRNSYAHIANQPRRPRFLVLSKDNDGVTFDANIDASVVEARFYFECPPANHPES